ncbi:unnamed protein product [Heligmosomoides polygyrus]|uniref:Uncharacterized protein n=1 Tax=Heligmosomoides polygyrus TaxID=6339 RepID=A0A183FYS0_HELPZ|nr:unnamed protein product [Heligmosomoides polygyrus]
MLLDYNNFSRLVELWKWKWGTRQEENERYFKAMRRAAAENAAGAAAAAAPNDIIRAEPLWTTRVALTAA